MNPLFISIIIDIPYYNKYICYIYIHGIAVRLGDFPRTKKPFVEGK